MITINVSGRKIGRKFKPFIIAEMSGNHNSSIEQALKIVNAAASAGVDALKLQTYTADTMTLDINSGSFLISGDCPWQGQSLYSLYKKAFTPWEWHDQIFKRCRELGIIPFSTPFDPGAVDFLEELDVPLYKVASFENTDLSLIKKIASTGKPVIISTGMASIAELDETVSAARSAGCKELILLKCTSAYPALPDEANLVTIPHMRKLFNCEVGLSDHTAGIGAAVAAVALGASVVEKHFTISRAAGGVDAAFSLEPEELQRLVIETECAWRSLGKVHYGVQSGEKATSGLRRSLYIVEDLEQGELLTKKNVRSIRPGDGLAPKYIDIFLGKKVLRSIKKGTPLSWDIVMLDE